MSDPVTDRAAANEHILRLAAILNANPDAQYLLSFRGRSLPATFSESYLNRMEDGFTATVLNFWDGDSGNLFDVDYRLLPEKVFMNGKPLEF